MQSLGSFSVVHWLMLAKGVCLASEVKGRLMGSRPREVERLNKAFLMVLRRVRANMCLKNCLNQRKPVSRIPWTLLCRNMCRRRSLNWSLLYRTPSRYLVFPIDQRNMCTIYQTSTLAGFHWIYCHWNRASAFRETEVPGED